MQVTREELNPCTLKLSIVCDATQVKDGFDKAFKQIAKKIKLPGFRPGHAPRAMVENLVSKEELYELAAEEIVRKSFRQALEQEQIQADATVRPTVELSKLDQDANEAEFSAKVPLPPKVTLGDYKGLALEKPPVDVTDEEVERQIDEFRKRRQSRETVTDRGVEQGDVAVLSIKPEGAEGEARNFMVIAGQSFPQLDEAILGLRAEEMKNVELTFPEDFQEKDWATTTQKVQVTLNSLSAVKLPDVDDAFAQSLQTENVEDLRVRVRESLKYAKEQMLRDMVNDQLLERLHERSEVAVSDNMWEALASRRLQETADEQRQQGKTLEQYAAENGMTIEQLVEAWQTSAKKHIERALLIREVFTAEKMQLTNEELNRELFTMAGEYNVEPKQMLDVLQQNQALDELQFRAISRKVGDFLESNAQVTEVTPSEESAEATEEKPSKSKKSKKADAEAKSETEAPAEDAETASTEA